MPDYKIVQPDWEHWKLIKHIDVSSACLLSLDIEPEEISKLYDGAKHNKNIAELINKIEKRIKATKANLEPNGALKIYDWKPNHWMVGGNHPLINIIEFGKWAEFAGWELPDNFTAFVNNSVIAIEAEKASLALSSENNPFSIKEKNKMLSVIYGMAVKKYGYNSKSQRNAATGTNTGSISEDLAEMGIDVGSDTIRKYLKEASALYSKE